MKHIIDLDALGIGMANPAMFENRAFADGWNSLYSILQQAPVVDAEPVQHGRWIPVTKNLFSNAYYKCSVCGCKEKENGWPYCHCGAKMDADVAKMPESRLMAALTLLYRLLKQAKTSLGNAEQRQNNQEERDNLERKITTIEWIIDAVLKAKED